MDYSSTLTVCPYCGCGCAFYLEALDGRLVGVTPSQTSPTNAGRLCVKGWSAHEFVQSPQRLRAPMIRKGEKLEEVSWKDALDFTAERMLAIKEEHGPDAIGFLASAKVSNEENYVLQKLARAAVGTNSVDHCARL